MVISLLFVCSTTTSQQTFQKVSIGRAYCQWGYTKYVLIARDHVSCIDTTDLCVWLPCYPAVGGTSKWLFLSCQTWPLVFMCAALRYPSWTAAPLHFLYMIVQTRVWVLHICYGMVWLLLYKYIITQRCYYSSIIYLSIYFFSFPVVIWLSIALYELSFEFKNLRKAWRATSDEPGREVYPPVWGTP